MSRIALVNILGPNCTQLHRRGRGRGKGRRRHISPVVAERGRRGGPNGCSVGVSAEEGEELHAGWSGNGDVVVVKTELGFQDPNLEATTATTLIQCEGEGGARPEAGKELHTNDSD